MEELKRNTVKVLNNEARVHTIGYAYAKSEGKLAAVPLTIRLLPGLNEVLATAWEKAKKLPVVASQIDNDVFREVATDSKGLAGMTIDDAIDTVRQTLDRELLRTWRKKEARAPVRTAIDKQIDEVTYVQDRDSAAAAEKGMDLKPREATAGMSAADVAGQVQGPDEAQPDDVPERRSKAPPQPPEELTRQLRDVPKAKSKRSR
jgi:hypothetical protein